MVTVPAGSFQRDATATNISIITTAYKMSTYEITREQFLTIMGTDPSNTTYSSGTKDPVQMVNWYHAIAFCNKLSIVEGLTPVYTVTGVNFATLAYASIPTSINTTWDAATATWTNNGYRLPTQMEFMWAAMGATSDRSNGYKGIGTNKGGYTKGYAGSTEVAGAQVNIGNYIWYNGNVSDNKSRPVGGKLPNELGLYDINGNINEWNWDWYGLYPIGALTDYQGSDSGTLRVLIGGSWDYVMTYCTVAYHGGNNPHLVNYNFGFRVVRP
jgi:formylglycine-generating enzyme required for sulfatase activity